MTEKKKILLVNFSSLRPKGRHSPVELDYTCILKPSDHNHPDLKHDSYIVYQRANFLDVQKLLRDVEEGKYKMSQPFPLEVCDKICQGLIDSPLTRPSVLESYVIVTKATEKK